MTTQNVYDDVMKQAASACAQDLPDDANSDQLAAMKAHHGFLICEMGQDTFEATEALIAQDVARLELWAYPTPYKPEGYLSADHMIYTLINGAGRSRSRLSIMRAVGTFCEYAEQQGIETDAAVRNWTNCREVYAHLKRAAKDKDPERLQAILRDVVTIQSRDDLREKYKTPSANDSKAGEGTYISVKGELYYVAHITDAERAAPALGKLFGDGLAATGDQNGDVIRLRVFEPEQVGDIWEGVLEEEKELEPVPL